MQKNAQKWPKNVGKTPFFGVYNYGEVVSYTFPIFEAVAGPKIVFFRRDSTKNWAISTLRFAFSVSALRTIFRYRFALHLTCLLVAQSVSNLRMKLNVKSLAVAQKIAVTCLV